MDHFEKTNLLQGLDLCIQLYQAAIEQDLHAVHRTRIAAWRHDKWYKWSHLSRTNKIRKTSAELPGLSWNNQIRWGCASSELIWSSWMQNDLAPVLSAFHSTEILTQSDKPQESTKCTKTVHGVGQSGLSTAIILLNCRSVIPKKKTLSLSLKPPACRQI